MINDAPTNIPILLVDDRPENLLALEALLENQGLDFVRAASGNEALRLSLKQDYALVLMDVQMPEMDGFEAAELMRANPKTSHLPIIFITAALKDEIHQFKGYEAGAVDYLLKPVEPAILRNKVRIFCELFRYRREIEHHRQALEALVEERTAKLRDSCEQLQNELAERQRAEKAVLERDTFIHNILESIDEGFIVVDREYTIRAANRAYCSAATQPPEQIVGQKCYAVSHRLDRPCFMAEERCAVRQTFETGKAATVTHVHTTNGGTKQYVEIKAYPFFDPAGKVVAAIETLNDVTERTKLEDQLRQSQKMEAIGTLAGGIAHDFNNILAPILGYAELLLSTAPAAERLTEGLTAIRKASLRAKELVQQILTFSRQAAHDRKPMLPQPVVKESLKLLRASLPTTIEIREEFSTERGMILGNPTQLQQIVMNLCTNAYHAMRVKGGVLGIALKEVDVAVSDDKVLGHELAAGSYVLLEVSDTGCGMDRTIMAKIFEPYFTTKKSGEGTGLGLAIVHGIVKSAGGHITVYSEPGQGTTFRVYLPRTEAESPAAEERQAAQESLPHGNARLLVVDDEEAITRILAAMLTSLGYRVTVCNESDKAWALFAKDPAAFDALLTDMTMPQMTGLELSARVIGLRPDLPVLLCTGFSELVTKEKAMALGIRAFLMKPISTKELALAISKALGGTDAP